MRVKQSAGGRVESGEVVVGARGARRRRRLEFRAGKGACWIAVLALLVLAVVGLRSWWEAASGHDGSGPSAERTAAPASEGPGVVLSRRLLTAAGNPGWPLELHFAEPSGRALSSQLVRVTPATPLRFELRSERAGHLLLLYITDEGAIYRLYPNRDRELPTVPPGEPVSLATELVLETDDRSGSYWAIALVSEEPLVPLPRILSEVVTDRGLVGYPHGPAGGPASAFLDWLVGRLARMSGAHSSAFVRLEVTPARF